MATRLEGLYKTFIPVHGVIYQFRASQMMIGQISYFLPVEDIFGLLLDNLGACLKLPAAERNENNEVPCQVISKHLTNRLEGHKQEKSPTSGKSLHVTHFELPKLTQEFPPRGTATNERTTKSVSSDKTQIFESLSFTFPNPSKSRRPHEKGLGLK